MKSYKPREVEFNLENKTLKYESGDVFLASRNFNRKFFNSSCCFLRILLEKLSRAKNWNSYQSFVNRKIASWTLKLWRENRNFCYEFFARDNICLFFGGRFVNKSSLIFSLKNLPGETLCKLLQIFPPKVLHIQVILIYTRLLFLHTILIN